MRIRKGDLVEIVSGDEAGKTGVIKSVLTNKKAVIIEDKKLVHKHLKPSQDNPKGGRIKKEAHIAESNVLPVCKNRSCARHNKGVRIRVKCQGGLKTRHCVKCDNEISTND